MKQNLEEYLILEKLCKEVKENISLHENECKIRILDALKKYPDAPQPQNLLGILAERHNNCIQAMAHYRASYALSPSYRPSRRNMDRYADFNNKTKCCYMDQDCDDKEK